MNQGYGDSMSDCPAPPLHFAGRCREVLADVEEASITGVDLRWIGSVMVVQTGLRPEPVVGGVESWPRRSFLGSLGCLDLFACGGPCFLLLGFSTGVRLLGRPPQ